MYLLGQFFHQSVDLSHIFVIHGGEDLYGIFCEGQVLAVFQHLLHELAGYRCPGTILDEGNEAVLIAALGQMVDEFLHEGEHIAVVGGGGQHQLTVTESIFHSLGHVVTGQVCNHDLLTLGFQLLRQQLHSLLVWP